MTVRSQPSKVRFHGFLLDLEDQSLRRDGEVLPLRPKPLAVLAHLISRRSVLVTKEELLASVWGDAVVGDWVLANAAKELRQVLADDPRSPVLIETVHRRGYRFIGTVEGDESGPTEEQSSLIVGRDRELELLDEAWRLAGQGKRQIVFLVGEAGIGKTAVVDRFLERLHSREGCLVAHGQCLEQLGTSEPYLPFLEAFGRLGSSDRELSQLLTRLAPSWRGLFPGTIDDGAPAASTVVSERMVREMASVIEAIDRPLVLVLEDLHWADYGTLDLVNRLARGRSAARLVLVATYRAADLAFRDHPLKAMHRELLARGFCRDVWLLPLNAPAIAEYLLQRFAGLENARELAEQIERRTDGNALFVVNVTDELAASGRIAQADDGWTFRGDVASVATAIPGGLRQLLEMRIDRLSTDERSLLEACSVVGRSSAAQEIAAALDRPTPEVDAALADVARRLFLLREAGESVWPDGSVSGRYDFAHSLYRDVLHDLAVPAHRRLWHERIARRIETGFHGRTPEVASSLAWHFETAGLLEDAVHYLEEAAERASRYGAEHQAGALLDRAIEILGAGRRTPERMLKTIRLSLALGQVLQARRGFASDASEKAFARAWELAEELQDNVQLFQAAIGLLSGYIGRARFDAAAPIAARLPALIDEIPIPSFLLTANLFLGMLSYHSGSLAEARRLLDTAVAIGEIPQPAIIVNFLVVVHSYRALTLLHQDRVAESLESAAHAMRRAQTEGPFVQASAAMWTSFIHLIVGDSDGVEAAASLAESLGVENDYPLHTAIGRFGNGWVAARRGRTTDGVETMRSAISQFRGLGQVTALPAMIASMAAVMLDAGEVDRALETLTEVEELIRSSGEVRFTAEVLRLKGECHAAKADVEAARQMFAQALELARDQGAKLWEKRILESIGRLR